MHEENWQSYFGKPTEARESKSKVASASNAAKGGVALAIKEGTHAKKAAFDADAAILRDQGRWDEITQAIGNGKKHLKMSSLYGFGGASGDGERFRLNEDLIGRALCKLIEAGDTPYLICGDFNIVPQESPAIARLIAKGLLVDVPYAFAQGEHPTIRPDGAPQEGEKGKGRIRIDSVLANRAAFALVVACKLRWDLCLSDHVPIEVELDIERYGADVKVPQLPTAFPEMKWGPKDRKGERAGAGRGLGRAVGQSTTAIHQGGSQGGRGRNA